MFVTSVAQTNRQRKLRCAIFDPFQLLIGDIPFLGNSEFPEPNSILLTKLDFDQYQRNGKRERRPADTDAVPRAHRSFLYLTIDLTSNPSALITELGVA